MPKGRATIKARAGASAGLGTDRIPVMASRVTPFVFRGPAGSLEALWKEPEGTPRGSAVVAHADPLHGGTMHFKVLFRMARALARAGYGVLRFNFRGVGGSEGRPEGGLGERDDFRAALDAAESRGGAPLLSAGFSFGATVALAVGGADPRVAVLIGAGVPLTRWSFEGVGQVAKPTLLLAGGSDEFLSVGGPPGEPERLLRSAASGFSRLSVEVLPGADHFFTDGLDWVEGRVFQFAAQTAAAVVA